jgi:hypothetical protein
MLLLLLSTSGKKSLPLKVDFAPTLSGWSIQELNSSCASREKLFIQWCHTMKWLLYVRRHSKFGKTAKVVQPTWCNQLVVLAPTT